METSSAQEDDFMKDLTSMYVFVLRKCADDAEPTLKGVGLLVGGLIPPLQLRAV